MPKAIQISINAAQAAVDAINHRLRVHEQAFKVKNVGGSDPNAEVQKIVDDMSMDQIHSAIYAMKEARSVLCQV